MFSCRSVRVSFTVRIRGWNVLKKVLFCSVEKKKFFAVCRPDLINYETPLCRYQAAYIVGHRKMMLKQRNAMHFFVILEIVFAKNVVYRSFVLYRSFVVFVSHIRNNEKKLLRTFQP